MKAEENGIYASGDKEKKKKEPATNAILHNLIREAQMCGETGKK